MLSYFVATYTTDTGNWGLAAALGPADAGDDAGAVRGVAPAVGRQGDGHRMTRLLFRVYCALVLAFLLLPIAAIVPLSFSSGSFLSYPLPGWSLRWYDEVFNGEEMAGCAGQLAACGAGGHRTVGGILGTLAALGLARQRGWWSGGLKLLLLSPMIVPVILVAVGSYFFLAPLSLTSTFTGLTLAHTVIAVPFVIVPVLTALEGLDPNLARAAASCGAPPTADLLARHAAVHRAGDGLGRAVRVCGVVRRRGHRAAGRRPRAAHAAARDVQRPARQHHAGADGGGHGDDRLLDRAVPGMLALQRRARRAAATR
jgi:ABC-type sugar transport system permease subunit